MVWLASWKLKEVNHCFKFVQNIVKKLKHGALTVSLELTVSLKTTNTSFSDQTISYLSYVPTTPPRPQVCQLVFATKESWEILVKLQLLDLSRTVR